MARKSEKEPTEADRAMVRGQQHTGNHDKPVAERGGSDIRGGTRAGAENVEPTVDDGTNDGFEKVDEQAQAETARDRRKGYD